MAINADKPHLWKNDVAASVDLFNKWFLKFAPKAYRDSRAKTTKDVEATLLQTKDLTAITPQVLQAHPEALPALRMSGCPPLARDRLVGLSEVSKHLVWAMEKGAVPTRMNPTLLATELTKLATTITKLLDVDIFPWLAAGVRPSRSVRLRASTIIADRLCGAVSDPIVRNAQEKRQLALITNKRRKEEATKIHQLKNTHSTDVRFFLFLCGYFDSGYLGYEAAEGIDWIWEHRIGDLDQLGI
jgi:hypothetical protein